jgi:glycosyltransferase involved in cell wall biosynthesis
LAGRIAMLPFIIWNFPLIKTLWPKPVFDFLYLFYRVAFSRRLLRAISNADIVHCFSTGHLAACVTGVCRKRGIRLIHSPPVHFGKWGDSRLLLSAYARADRVLCLSRTFKKDFERHNAPGPARITVIPALTIEHSDSRRPDRAPQQPFVLFLGRREKHKGLDLLLSAFKGISGTNAVLVIAGPGDKNPCPPPFSIDLGEVDEGEKQWLLQHCTVFCVPSDNESFGIVYAEAMRFAKPVVALDVAPVNEIVINGETGILVPPGGRGALASALTRLLTDGPLRNTMGYNGLRRYAEKYSPVVVLKQIIREYEKLL